MALQGSGELAFSGEANLWPAANVLATPGLPLLGTLRLATAGGLSVGARWRLTGEFEVSATRTSAQLARLDVHRRLRSALTVSARAALGITADLGRHDVLAWLAHTLGADPEVDVVALVGAGLTNEQVTTLQQAVAASLDRTLSIAAQLQVAASDAHEALASFEVDLGRLDAPAEAALDEAVRGSLGPLAVLATTRGGHGLRLVASTATRLQRRRTRWRINLLGALNASGLAELVRRGSCSYDPIGGALTIADEVSARRLSVSTRPLETDPDRLRRVLLESLIVTAAYRSSGALRTLNVRLRHAFVEQRSRASAADLRRCYAAIEALGLCDHAETARRLASVPGVSRLTFVLECRLASRRADALFLGDTGTPHALDHFERLARTALLALVPRDDPAHAYRRLPLADDETWARMRELGQPNLGAALPADLARDPLRVAVVAADYSTVTWWSAAMRRAGCALAEARAYLDAGEAPATPSDERLQDVRRRLERALASVVSKTRERWGEPWDVLALHLASGGRAATRAALVSPALTASYPESAPSRTFGERSRGAGALARGPRLAARGSRRAAKDPEHGRQSSIKPGRQRVAPEPVPEYVGSAAPEPVPEYVGSGCRIRPPKVKYVGSGFSRIRPPVEPAAGFSRRADAFTPAERDLLARHVVNLRDGRLAGDGPGAATDAQVRGVFAALAAERHGPRRSVALQRAGTTGARPIRLVFVAHGGLVPEAEGLRSSLARIAFWRAHGLYPLFFVWHTGLAETLAAFVRTAVSKIDPRHVPRGPLLDALVEAAVRRPGQSVWAQMKRSAERAAAPGGGARLVAELTRELCAGGKDVEIHALGHSAGCIFLAHFLSSLVGPRIATRRVQSGQRGDAEASPRVGTVHFVAPAITTSLFVSRVKRLVGPDLPIRRFTLYALRREFELDDRVGPYGRSLLHLVSRACEPETPANLLGLQESVERDVRLVRFFGLAGPAGPADALFAPTPPDAPPRDRTEATTHAGFDDDGATVGSIALRIGDAGTLEP